MANTLPTSANRRLAICGGVLGHNLDIILYGCDAEKQLSQIL